MKRQKWITEEILQLMEDRRLNKNNETKYKQLNNDIRKEDVEKPKRNTEIQSVKRSNNYKKNTIFSIYIKR